MLCALGAIVLGETPTDSDYELVGNFYDLDKDLIEADRRLFDQFKHTNADPKVSHLKTASEVIKNELLEMVPEFIKVATILAVIPATCVRPKDHSAGSHD